MKKIFTATILIALVITPAWCASLTLTPKNISDNQTAPMLSFNSEDSRGIKLSPQYLQVDYEPFEESPAWYMLIYTSNPAAVGYQKGGLINTKYPEWRLPLGWNVQNTSDTVPNADNPSTPGNGWLWLKDKHDEDIPETDLYIESWKHAVRNSDYCKVCWADNYSEYVTMDGGRTGESPLFVYFEGIYDNTPAGEYRGNIWLEMVPLDDSVPPIIAHVPAGSVVGGGNRLIIEARVEDNYRIKYIKIHYKIDENDWVTRDMAYSKGVIRERMLRRFNMALSRGQVSSKSSMAPRRPKDMRNNGSIGVPRKAHEDVSFSDSNAAVVKYARYTFEPWELVGVNQILYCIEAYDGSIGTDPVWWNGKDPESPQSTEFVHKISFEKVEDGNVEVPDGNPDDGATTLEIPTGAIKTKEPIKISVEKLIIDEVPELQTLKSEKQKECVSVYEFEAEEKEHLKFRKPVTLTLLYHDLDNDGLVELPDGTETSVNEEDLKVAWWDGFAWRYMASTVDTEMNVVSTNIMHFSRYGLFPAQLSADDYRPEEKIITPATVDNINDFAQFGLSGDFKINIFDITGRKIRTLDGVSIWEGDDNEGNTVESGVYIYQFVADVYGENKLVSGTITVAK